jgi:protein-S-isoprenylcysteine O-methyltransferase Ste14
VCQNDNSVSDIIPNVPRRTIGHRGEVYVGAQFVLLILVIAGPLDIGGWPGPLTVGWPLNAGAIASAVAGVVLLSAGTRRLGRNLTPLPYPKHDGVFVDRGIYRVVRHPIYGGLMLLAFGWSLRRGGGLALAYTVMLVALLALKARAEERWLIRRYPGYAAYRLKTRRFIPFVW